MADKPAPKPGHFLPGGAGFEFRSPRLVVFDATSNLRDTQPTEAARLELDRRQALQANCLSAVFFGAAKASFPLRGVLLSQWTWLIKHGGDENSGDKVRDHGSARSLALWMNQGFASTDPGTCNTFVASSAKVG